MWIELYSAYDNAWHCVDISSYVSKLIHSFLLSFRGTVDEGEKFQQEGNKRKAPKRVLYYFGFEGTRIVDVTPRYCLRWSEILNERKLTTTWIDSLLKLPVLRSDVEGKVGRAVETSIMIEDESSEKGEEIEIERENIVSADEEIDLLKLKKPIEKANEGGLGYNNAKELAQFDSKINNEPFPDTLSAFQKHHLFCIEKFFNQGQV
jgi:hypothetical protein